MDGRIGSRDGCTDGRTDADEWMDYSIARLLGRSTAARFILGFLMRQAGEKNSRDSGYSAGF